MISVAQAAPQDWEPLVGMLVTAGLPTEDLSASALADFVVARDESGGQDEIAGFAGLQKHSGFGLVRSLVVADSRRGQGIGAMLLDNIARRARRAEIMQLWLLTIDADGFFSRHGFSVATRESAPAPIRATEEFMSLCSGDAVLMWRQV
jgi:amino-acid N-acetyltransferase